MIGLAAWGLRRSELAALHHDQLLLQPADGETPYIEFKIRKNGPSQVNLLYGVDVLTARLTALDADDDWHGYLFPLHSLLVGHIVEDTVYNRFQRLATQAGVTVEGATPKPHMGRRFWYEAFQEVVTELVAALQGVTKDQGSDDVATMARHYHSPEARRRACHDLMAQELADTFGDLIERSPGIDPDITGGLTRGEDVPQDFQPEDDTTYAVRHPRDESDTARTIQDLLHGRRDNVGAHHRLLGIDNDSCWHYYHAITRIITIVDEAGRRVHRQELGPQTGLERWLTFVGGSDGLGWDVLLEQRDARSEFTKNPLPLNPDHEVLGIDRFGRWLHYQGAANTVTAINWAGGIDARVNLVECEMHVSEFIQLIANTIGWIDQKVFTTNAIYEGLDGFNLDVPRNLFDTTATD